MRKALILLVVFAVVGAAAFADGATAKWSISSLYGIGMVSGNTTVTGLVPFDWAREGGNRTRLNFTYTAADGNAGFNSRLQMADTMNASFSQLNGWVKLLNGMLTVRSGMLDDYTIATKDWWCYGATDGSLGIFFDFAPMAGLDIGFYQVIPAAAQDSATDGDNIGFSYAIPDIGSLQAGVTLLSKATTTTGTAVYGGFQYTGVKDLTAVLEAKATLADGATLIALNEMVSYAMGMLTVGARIGEYNNGTDFRWGIEPTVSYKVNENVTVNAIVNAYNAPLNDNLIWTSGALYGGKLGKGAAGDTNYGAGASLSYAANGFTLTVGDYYGAAADVGGNVIYLNADLSL